MVKWFDITQPPDAPVNSDPTRFAEQMPLLDPGDPESYPDMVYPGAVEPFV